MTISWWCEEASVFLAETLAFINESRLADNPIARCDALCKALNKTWNTYFRYRQQREQLTEKEKERRSDSQAFTQLLLRGCSKRSCGVPFATCNVAISQSGFAWS